ncbi:MAG: SIS domain-containing protein [Bilophila wadsworthia]
MTQSVRSHTGPTALIKLAQDVLNTEIAGLAAVGDQLNAGRRKSPLVLALGLLAACTGRVVVTGIGKSGLVGRKLAATFSSTGTPAFFLHPVEGAHGDLGSLRKDDVIIAISNSGETAELNAILPALKSLGTSLIAMTGREDSTLGRLADVTLHSGVPREACPHGLAPTASTTAVLALGDALAVCLMQLKSFTEKDFLRYHPGGSLGQRLKLNVSEVMRTEGLPQLSETSLLSEALRQLDQGKLGAVLLLDNEHRISGILTDGDVRRAVCRGTLNPEAPVSTVMTPSPRCGTQSDTVATLLELMESKAITVLPIADEERRLLGMVHMHDLLGQGSVAFSQH